ncbi:uncharacterized protein LOC113363056 [Ctenocephalides felis]|uniref:uncharacterized protein LOC113363056 n=1 Tax=Ctenocephalides felis TaxID=7515 RepID=UPI000E6E5606|nr:uncharacterized protein LOC113363056 [Ctenocephalides felis]
MERDLEVSRNKRKLLLCGAKSAKKVLSLFTVVSWDQAGACASATGGGTETGTCLPAAPDCALRGGTAAGPCAAGYGICCVFMATCGASVLQNGTYFVNPNHPNPTDSTGSCQITVPKLGPDVCQIRLDFETFSIAGPDPASHVCTADRFLVSGGTPAPVICGNSNGDHMYIDTGVGPTNPVTLTVVTSGPSTPRTWKIKVTHIPCSTIYRADPGCLQYYTGVSGKIKSFNYDPTNGRQLSNQDYSLCVRSERNFCSIQYTACPDTVNNRSRAFTLSGNSNQAVQAMVGAAGSPNTCSSDWLSINCAANADRTPPATTCEDRICGGTFSAEISMTPATVFSNVRPFRLAFHTDATEAPTDTDNRGFCLDYVQQPCANSV